jgi:hypothetical protein
MEAPEKFEEGLRKFIDLKVPVAPPGAGMKGK